MARVINAVFMRSINLFTYVVQITVENEVDM